MKIIIVYAHPNKEGNCGHLLSIVKENIEELGHEHRVLDLYKEGYDPVMKNEEHYTSGRKKIAKDTEYYQRLFKENDRFVFIYPTWWNSPPAILKGFFDRTFTGGFSHKFSKGMPVGLLNGKASVISTSGSPAFIQKMRNRSINIVVKDVLRFSGIDARGYLIGSATWLRKKKIEKVAEKAVKALI
ncbi:MAG: NAD(P)H-dependent oxidoreductase [Nanobdellota archaeon]